MQQSLRTRIRIAVSALSAVVLVSASVVLVSTDAVAVSPSWSNAVVLQAPSNSRSSNPYSYLNAISCPAAGTCTAVGAYLDSANQNGMMAASESNNQWSQEIQIEPPADSEAESASIPGFPDLTAVSCVTAGDCTAVGSYRNDSTQGESGGGQILPIEVTETDGVWGQAHAVGIPGSANPTQEAYFSSVSCLSTGNCVAVGFYGNFFPMAAIETNGTWAPASSISGISGIVGAISVSCVDDVCTVLAGDNAVTETSGAWSSVTPIVPPSDNSSNYLGGFYSISCWDAQDCAAIGPYGGSTGSGEGEEYQVTFENSGTWSNAIRAPGFNVLSSYGPSVSCLPQGDGTCQFVAGYQSVEEANGTWATELSFPIPADDLCGGSCGNEGYTSVSCFSVSACTTAGGYPNSTDGLSIVAQTGPHSPGPLRITTSALPSGKRGVVYDYQLSATGGQTPYKWKNTSILPKGLKLTSSGLVRGTPSTKLAAGSYPFTVRVTDSTKKKHQVATTTLELTLS